MLLALGLILSTVMGTDDGITARTDLPEPESGTTTRPGDQYLVRYEGHLLSMPGLDWRDTFADRLHLLSRQEGASVWSVDEATKQEILKLGQPSRDEEDRKAIAPRLAYASVGQPVGFGDLREEHDIADLTPTSKVDGEVTRTRYSSTENTLHLGSRVRVLSSELVGVGVKADLRVEAHRLVAMHSTERQVEERVEYAVPVLSRIPVVGDRLFRNVGIGHKSSNVEVPEVASVEVEGQWLVPSEGALVISLGPVSDESDGTIRERLVILSAQLLPMGSF